MAACVAAWVAACVKARVAEGVAARVAKSRVVARVAAWVVALVAAATARGDIPALGVREIPEAAFGEHGFVSFPGGRIPENDTIPCR